MRYCFIALLMMAFMLMAASVTALAQDQPVHLVYPDGEDGLSLASEVSAALMKSCGVTPTLVSAADAIEKDGISLREPLKHGTLVLLGNNNTNRATLPLYTQFLMGGDGAYPGPGGYELRSISMPFGKDSAALVVGASDQAGLKAGVDALIARLNALPANTILPLKPFIQTKFGGKMEKGFAPVTSQIPEAVNGYGFFAHVFNWVWTGDPAYEPAIRAEYEKFPKAVDHYEIEYASRAYRALRAYGFFTPEEQKKADEVLWGMVNGYMSGGYGGVFGTDLTWIDDKPVEFTAGLPPEKAFALGNRHQAMWMPGVCLGIEDLLHRSDFGSDRKAVLERNYNIAMGYVAALCTAGRDDQDDITSAMSDQSFVRQALGQPVPYAVTNGVLQWTALRALACTDNLGHYSGQGNYEECRAGGQFFSSPAGAAWKAAAYFYRDPGWNWLVHRFNFGFGGWGMVVQPGDFDPGDLPSIEPKKLLGVQVLPARSYHHAKAEKERKEILPPIKDCFEKISLRDGFDPNNQYLLLQGWPATAMNTEDANCIIRYTDKGTLWLVQNTDWFGHYFKNGVYVSDGVNSVKQPAAVILKAAVDTPNVGLTSSLHPNQGGLAWNRSIVWRKGRYFVVLDSLKPAAGATAQQSQYVATCTWRSMPYASIEDKAPAGQAHAWIAQSGDDRMVLRSASAVNQQSGLAQEMEGALKPYILRQTKRIEAKAGGESSFQNLIYVTGPGREQSYQVRKLSEQAAIVRGRLNGSPEEITVAGTGSLKLGALTIRSTVFYLSPDEMIISKDGRAQWNGVPIASGVVKASLRLRIAGLLEQAWAKSLTGQSGKSASQTKAAGRTKPVWRWNGAAKRGEIVDVSTVSSSVPPLTGEFRGALSEFVDHATPLWGSTQFEGDVTVTFTLPKLSTIDRVEVWGSHYDGLPPPKAKSAAYNVEFSTDGFKKDIRGGEIWFNEFGYPIQVYKGIYYAYQCLHADNLHQRARQVRIRGKGFSATEVTFRSSRRGDTTPTRSAVGHLRDKTRNDLIVVTSNDEILALGSEGRKLWSHQLGGKITAMLVADADEDGLDEVLVGTLEHRLYCFRGDGSQQWMNDYRGKVSHGNPWSIGLWRREKDKPLEILLGCFNCWVRFTRDGAFISYAHSSGAWYDAMLPRGLDLQNRGVEDQVFRATHWSGMAVMDGVTDANRWFGAEEGWGLGMFAWPDPKDPNILFVSDTRASVTDPRSGKRLWERVTGLNTSFDISGDTLWLGRRDGFVEQLDSQNNLLRLLSLDTAVNAVKAWKGGVAVGTDTDVRLYDKSGKLISTIPGSCARLEVIGFPGEPILAVMGKDSSVTYY